MTFEVCVCVGGGLLWVGGRETEANFGNWVIIVDHFIWGRCGCALTLKVGFSLSLKRK